MPRTELKKRLVETRSDTYKECYDQACQIELGRELAAEVTLATQISKLGSKCVVSSARAPAGSEVDSTISEWADRVNLRTSYQFAAELSCAHLHSICFHSLSGIFDSRESLLYWPRGS